MPKRRSLSVCSLAGGNLERTALILDQFRPVADEILCVIDARASLDGIAALIASTDRCIRAEVIPANTEQLLAWMHKQCSGDWILRVDNDEPPSEALIAQLPDLILADDVAQYHLRRLWVWPDEYRYIDEYPWADDFQIRLVRNDPKTLRFTGGVHTSAELAHPHRYVEAPLYHLDCLINAPHARRAKAERYEQALPGLRTPRGFPMNGYFFPETLTLGCFGSVPSEDLDVIRKVLEPGPASAMSVDIPVVTLDSTKPCWGLRDMPESAYMTRIESLESVTDMHVQERRVLPVRIHNLGSETWPWGDFVPAFRMGCRWFDESGAQVVLDGSRTFFSADIPPGAISLQKAEVVAPPTPGRFVLEVNVLHEGKRWCEGGWRTLVMIHAEDEGPRPKWWGANPAVPGSTDGPDLTRTSRARRLFKPPG